jgi:hypothetical protein
LLYANLFHLLAGMVTGAVFRVHALLLLLAFIILESVLLGLAHNRLVCLWALGGMTAVELGYVAGICSRWALEQAGYFLPAVKPRVDSRRLR